MSSIKEPHRADGCSGEMKPDNVRSNVAIGGKSVRLFACLEGVLPILFFYDERQLPGVCT